jgi:hypothetical protein
MYDEKMNGDKMNDKKMKDGRIFGIVMRCEMKDER